MSLTDVKTDYVQERMMLETWRNRMDISTEVTDVPPESAMSFSYRHGWKLYLGEVLKISARMIDMCAAAEDSEDTTELDSTLRDEAKKYDDLAVSAKNKGLTELQAMLEWEAESRREVADSLGSSQPAGVARRNPQSGTAAKKKAAKKKAAKK